MKTTHLYTLIACGALALLLFVGNARAESSADALAAVQFPVAELGGCTSKEACKTYCDDSTHMEACISFAEKNGLMPTEEIAMAKKFIAAGGRGPGGCIGKDSCETYCNDITHIDACVLFAEENGMMSGDELAEAKKVQAAIRSGITPPACRNKKECDAYCESADHMSECITFAKAAGLMSAEEQANADKMLQAIQSGAKPPACRGKAECDAYCGQDEHFAECLEFGKAAGFMTDEEYEVAKKTGGKGPGGCRGKEECDAFCTNSQENEEVCFNFGKENGLIPEGQLREMEQGDQKFRESFSNMPPEVVACLQEKVGAETFEKMKTGTMRPNRSVGEQMGACFGQFEQQRMQNESQGGPPPGSEQQPRPEQQYNGPREGQQYGTPPEGGYPPPCEGENCRPPEGAYTMPPEGAYQRPPEGTYPMPEGEYRSPEGEAYPPSESVEMTSPASEPVVSTESLSAAAILFLHAFGFEGLGK